MGRGFLGLSRVRSEYEFNLSPFSPVIHSQLKLGDLYRMSALFICFQEIQESIKNREPQLNLIRKQSGEFVHRGRQIMEPYKRLLNRRWDDLSARIGQLEEELEDTKKRAEEARAKGGRVETEIIVTVRYETFFRFRPN